VNDEAAPESGLDRAEETLAAGPVGLERIDVPTTLEALATAASDADHAAKLTQLAARLREASR